MRYRLPLFLAVQALLGFWNLGLLSPWMDEVTTLDMMRHDPAFVVRVAANDIHPPTFYLLLWGWQRLPLGLDPAVQARLLTVLLALAATLAADWLLARRLPPPARTWFLALWCTAPCLLLYARMCRSYSMQVLAAVLAVGALLRCLETPGRRRAIFTGLALLLALYTHYAPGIALLLAANLALAFRRRWRDVAWADAVVALGLLPWALWLARALATWTRHGAGYAAIGGASEYALKLAYWGMSAVAGEAVPDALLLAALALTPFVALVLWWGAARWPALAKLTLVTAAIAFIGVARWVSYPFLPARLLFLLPLLLLLFAAGATARPRPGQFATAALLLLFLAGDWCYFHKLAFRNKQYPMPMREIAALIEPPALPLVDSTNSDAAALEYALGSNRKVWQTANPETAARLADPSITAVWFLRNTHDVSAGALNTRYETQLRASLRLVGVHPYQPFTPLERSLMSALGMTHPPAYFSELLEFRR